MAAVPPGPREALALIRKYLEGPGARLPEAEVAALREAASILEACWACDIRRIGGAFQDGLVLFDREARAIYLNPANEEMVGITREEGLGRGAAEFAGSWIDNATTLQVFSAGKAFTSITIPRRTGRQLLQTGVPLLDEGGGLEGVVVINKDISELLAIRKRLDATQTQLALTEEIRSNQAQMIQHLTGQAKVEGAFVYEGQRMAGVVAEAVHIAKSDATALVMGETGCGKELFADIIHAHSARSGKPYFKVNCAAIPETLLESELFGYEKGAFTGADPRGRTGLFELANHGTLLLDEIGELPMSFQPKLLRVLQSRQILRVGGTRPIELDVRIIAATNRDLKKMVAAGSFREDLYYRIHVLPVQIPPLRERPEDIDALLRHYLGVFNRKYGNGLVLDPLVYFKLRQYAWPGNVRELENVLERWAVTMEPYAVIRWEQVVHLFTDQPSGAGCPPGTGFRQRTMAEIMDEYQREVLLWASAEYGTVQAMGEALDLDHSTIVKKAKRLGIRFERGRRGAARLNGGHTHLPTEA